jgi:hypothetical protein
MKQKKELKKEQKKDDAEKPKREILSTFAQGDPIQRLDDTPFSQGDPIEKLD